MTLYCECETPVMDVEHDAGCRRCGRPVDFSPRVYCSRCGEPLSKEILAELWTDRDFVEHDDRGHLAAYEPTAENFAMARAAFAELAGDLLDEAIYEQTGQHPADA